MNELEEYIRDLADHSEEKNNNYLSSPRNKILVHAGIALNWLGDYFANPGIIWKKRTLPVSKVQFTGTSPEWNEVLIEECKRSPEEFLKLLKKTPGLKKKFQVKLKRNEQLILVRASENRGYYKVLDGMHRFVGFVMSGSKNVGVYLPVNEDRVLPVCEPHVVYDLMRGFERHANDEAGKQQLYSSLILLARTYFNVKTLLFERFDDTRVLNGGLREVLAKVRRDLP